MLLLMQTYIFFFQAVIARVKRAELAEGYMSPLVSMSELRLDY